MKKNYFFWVTLIAVCAVGFFSCKKGEGNRTAVNEEISLTAETSASEAGEGSLSSENVPENLSEEIEIFRDLTELNSNMVYAEVFNMLIEPQMYENKILRMRGNFTKFENPVNNNKTSYAVIITDALACCQQGIEFVWDFKGNEPAPNEEITVTGSYTITETEDGLSYCFITATSVTR